MSELSRATAGLPVRWAGGGSSTLSSSLDYRLIRGIVTAVVHAEDASFTIDNIITLASGLDPRIDPLDGAETVTIVNVQTENFGSGDTVTAIYNAIEAQWEVLMVEEFRLVRGTVVSGVNADATTLAIKNIQVLSGGVDPRTDPSDADETLTVNLIEKCCFATDERVTAIFNDTTQEWEVLLTERFRAIRGTWYSGTSTLLIDHVVVLDNGLDPRTDTTDATEQVSVSNIASDTYGSGDAVWADYNAKDGVWEARPKINNSTGVVVAHVTTAASASSTWNTPTTDGRCTNTGGTTGIVMTNFDPDPIPVGAVVKLTGSGVVITWSCHTLS